MTTIHFSVRLLEALSFGDYVAHTRSSDFQDCGTMLSLAAVLHEPHDLGISSFLELGSDGG